MSRYSFYLNPALSSDLPIRGCLLELLLVCQRMIIRPVCGRWWVDNSLIYACFCSLDSWRIWLWRAVGQLHLWVWLRMFQCRIWKARQKWYRFFCRKDDRENFCREDDRDNFCREDDRDKRGAVIFMRRHESKFRQNRSNLVEKAACMFLAFVLVVSAAGVAWEWNYFLSVRRLFHMAIDFQLSSSRALHREASSSRKLQGPAHFCVAWEILLGCSSSLAVNPTLELVRRLNYSLNQPESPSLWGFFCFSLFYSL